MYHEVAAVMQRRADEAKGLAGLSYRLGMLDEGDGHTYRAELLRRGAYCAGKGDLRAASAFGAAAEGDDYALDPYPNALAGIVLSGGGLGGLDGLGSFWSKIKKAVKKFTKPIATAAKGAVDMATLPVTILPKLVKNPMGTLKKLPGQLITKPLTTTMRVVGQSTATVAGKGVEKALDKSANKLQHFSNTHPLQTIGAAAAVVGSVFAAPAIAAGAGSLLASAGGAGGIAAAAGKAVLPEAVGLAVKLSQKKKSGAKLSPDEESALAQGEEALQQAGLLGPDGEPLVNSDGSPKVGPNGQPLVQLPGAEGGGVFEAGMFSGKLPVILAGMGMALVVLIVVKRHDAREARAASQAAMNGLAGSSRRRRRSRRREARS